MRILLFLCLSTALASCTEPAGSEVAAADAPATSAAPVAEDSVGSDEPVGEPLTETRKPIPVAGGGAVVSLDLSGYGPGTSVDVGYGGDEVATLTASADGDVVGPVTLPEAPAGLQVLDVRGATATGAALGHELRLLYPGKPRAGDDYSIYVEGFQPESSDHRLDEVAVSLDGEDFDGFFDSVVDPAGGVLVDLTLPIGPPTRELVVTSTRTGHVERVQIEVAG